MLPGSRSGRAGTRFGFPAFATSLNLGIPPPCSPTCLGLAFRAPRASRRRNGRCFIATGKARRNFARQHIPPDLPPETTQPAPRRHVVTQSVRCGVPTRERGNERGRVEETIHHATFSGAAIEEAYLLVQAGSPQVQSRHEGQRTVHEVNLQRRIGFVGGQEGGRRGNPPATRVRLVLEDDRVITAFPF